MMSTRVLEVDSRDVFLMITNKESKLNWTIRSIILNIQRMLQLIPEVKVNLVKRNANCAADWVAIDA